MIYATNFSNSFDHRVAFSIGGCKDEVFFIIANDYFGSVTNSLGMVESFDINSNWTMFRGLENVSYGTKIEPSRYGILHSVELSFVLPDMNSEISKYLSVFASNRVMAIVTDENGRSWFLGENKGAYASFVGGLRVTYEVNSGDNSATVKFTGKQLGRVREVASGVVAGLPLKGFANNSYPTPQYASPYNNPLYGTVSPNVIRTVVVDEGDIYLVLYNDYYIQAEGACNIYLPDYPEDGQMHIVKANFEASPDNIVMIHPGVDVSSPIDENIEAYIDIPYGALTFIYRGGMWHTTAFVY